LPFELSSSMAILGGVVVQGFSVGPSEDIVRL
jgi:hypothetical protein